MAFHELPFAFVALVTLMTGAASIELGFRLGRRRAQRRPNEVERAGSSAILGAHVGLLAFMLAFTFGVAASRFDARKQLLIEDANAIGTAGLRAGLLTPERARAVRAILIEYAEVRGVKLPAGELTFREAMARSNELTSALWRETERAVAEGHPSDEILAIYVDSVNDLIDTGSKRATVVFIFQLPLALWVALFAIAFLCLSSIGYQSGSSERKRPYGVAPLLGSLAIVLLIIASLDRPRGSMLRIAQEPMLSTLAQLRDAQAASD